VEGKGREDKQVALRQKCIWVLLFVWRISFKFVIGLIYMSVMTHSYVGHDLSICMSAMTHSYVGHDLSICVTWLNHTFDMTHSCLWRGSFVCALWPTHLFVDMAHSHLWNWIIYKCGITHLCGIVKLSCLLIMKWPWHKTKTKNVTLQS